MICIGLRLTTIRFRLTTIRFRLQPVLRLTRTLTRLWHMLIGLNGTCLLGYGSLSGSGVGLAWLKVRSSMAQG